MLLVFVQTLNTSKYTGIIKTIHSVYDSDDIYAYLSEKTDLLQFWAKSIEHEIEKARFIKKNSSLKKAVHKIEDHAHFRGSLMNVDFIYENNFNIEKMADLFYEIWDMPCDSFITRSLLSIGDYSVHTSDSKLGRLYFFGKSDKWYRLFGEEIFGEEKEKLKEIIKIFFGNLISNSEESIQDKMQKLIDEAIKAIEKKKTTKQWEYYFLKYPKITNNDCNNYIFKNQASTDTNHFIKGLMAEYIDGPTIKSSHINILHKAVTESKEVNKEKVKNCGWVQNYKESSICCKNGIKLYFKSNNWEIKVPEDIDIEHLLKTFKLEEESKDEDNIIYSLKADKSCDLVELAIQIINKM